MARLFVFAAAIMFAGSGLAQTVVDGSDKEISADELRVLMAAVTDDFRDPVSAQFRRLFLGADDRTWCGEVNGRNAYGGYVGFRPFRFDRDEKIAEVLPERSHYLYKLVRLPMEQAKCLPAERKEPEPSVRPVPADRPSAQKAASRPARPAKQTSGAAAAEGRERTRIQLERRDSPGAICFQLKAGGRHCTQRL